MANSWNFILTYGQLMEFYSDIHMATSLDLVLIKGHLLEIIGSFSWPTDWTLFGLIGIHGKLAFVLAQVIGTVHIQ